MVKKQLFVGAVSYGLGIMLNFGISVNSKSDVITFLSIIIGFFLSAIAILYASPLRGLLTREQSGESVSKWLYIINAYKRVTILSFSVILYLLIDFSDLSRFQIMILNYRIFEYEKFIFALVIVLVSSLLELLLQLFKNLEVPVND